MLQILFVFFLLICSSGNAQNVPFCSVILEYAQNKLPHCGVMKKSDGFIYVQLDENYIHNLNTFIREEGFEEPPYFGSHHSAGAHITLVYPHEISENKIGEIPEIGETIYFTLKGCKIINPLEWNDMDELYLLIVNSPRLDEIRHKYGLPKTKYDFHITIGMKAKSSSKLNKASP